LGVIIWESGYRGRDGGRDGDRDRDRDRGRRQRQGQGQEDDCAAFSRIWS